MKLHKGFFICLTIFWALFLSTTAGNSQTCSYPVMLGYDSSTYISIQEAYDSAFISGLTDFTLKIATEGLLEENVNFNQDGVTVVLEGGWDCSFSTRANGVISKIPGSLTISAGTVIPSNIGLATTQCAFDNDGDGYTSIGSCSGSADDCNDNDPNIHPYGEILGDGIDQDCDGHDVLFPVDFDCFYCHSVNYVNNIMHSYTEAPDSTCVGCHAPQVSKMLPGHYGQSVRTPGNNMNAGGIIGCTSCHDWHDPSLIDVGNANIVWQKVLDVWNINQSYEGLTCDNCHQNRAASHVTGTAHDNRIIDSSCAQCHTSDTSVLGQPGTGTLVTQADVDTLHRSDCLLCHTYTGTKISVATVQQAIEDGLNGNAITCLDCHAAHHSPATNQVSYNPMVDTSQPTQEGCANCHHDYDSVNGTLLGLSTWETILVEHDLDGTKDGSPNTCANCHNYDDGGTKPIPTDVVRNAISSGNPATCATCHIDKIPDVAHGALSGKHLIHLEMAGITNDCSVCHTTPPYFQSGADTEPFDGKYDLAETDVCNSCHQDWDPDGLPPEQDYKAGWSDDEFTLECADCHAEIVDNGDDAPVGGRRAVTSEFPNSSHAHYGAVLDSTSCQVCHDYANHADGTVNLLDPDGGAGYNFVYTTDITQDPDISNFCANCHDSDGAMRLELLEPPLDPMNPFANGNAPPDIATRFMGTVQWNEYYGDYCFGYEGSNRPVNSHHDISDADQTFSGAKLECLNCHGSHTMADSQKVANPFFGNLVWNGTLNEFCLACHNGGHDPMQPMLPADVGVPAFYTPPPDNIPGESCGLDMVYDCSGTCFNQSTVDSELTNNSCNEYAGLNLDCNIFDYDNGQCLPTNIPATECGTDMYWDCNDNCVDLVTLYGDPTVNNDGALENGACDEATGLDLNCTEFNYDTYACNACIGNDCSYIGGIDSCSYGANPWYIDVTWTNSAHGADSKRDWPGYSGASTVPEMDCVACHDSHGSYTNTNPAGNPYMLKDYVDGTQFIDDGVRPNAQWNGPPWDTTGTGGAVVITNPTADNIGPQLGNQFCVRCHSNWLGAYDWHSYCSGCLSCHSHGMAFDANDWGDPPSDTQWCP